MFDRLDLPTDLANPLERVEWFAAVKIAVGGALLEVPDRPAFQRLVLSGDLTTLALTCLPDMMSRSRNKRGPVLQFWSYRTISSA
jgi:hypothetical protein